jgi:ATP-dependent DNA ligase
LKIDGFRAPADINVGQGQLVSRTERYSVALRISPRGSLNIFASKAAVLDGEIASVDESGRSGRPVFRDLLFRRRQCVFIAFDLLYLNGKDLRTLRSSRERRC